MGIGGLLERQSLHGVVGMIQADGAKLRARSLVPTALPAMVILWGGGGGHQGLNILRVVTGRDQKRVTRFHSG